MIFCWILLVCSIPSQTKYKFSLLCSCVISYIQDISLLQQQEENIRELDEIENIEKQSERQGRWARVGEMRREFMIVVIHAKCN